MAEPTKLNPHHCIELASNGQVKFKESTLLELLYPALQAGNGKIIEPLHKTQCLAIQSDYKNKYHLSKTQFQSLHKIYQRYKDKLLEEWSYGSVAEGISDQDKQNETDQNYAKQLNFAMLEAQEFENHAEKLIEEYNKSNTRGNFELMERPEPVIKQ